MKCVVSGSFRKHYKDICKTIIEFEGLGVEVLSPQKSAIANPGEDFAFLESDSSRDMKSLEQDHLNAIKRCDFLYVYNPSGYTGTSVLMEIGFALGCGKKVHFLEQPQDQIIARFADSIGPPRIAIS